MIFTVAEQVAKSERHISFYLSCGSRSAAPVIFLHGWPELSISGGINLRPLLTWAFTHWRLTCVAMGDRAFTHAMKITPRKKLSLT